VSAVVVDAIAKQFGDVIALDNVSLSITDGELLTILGPSGSGKTTLLRIVAGLEQPSAGRIFIAQRDITDQPPQTRSIGMVFQGYALFPNLTVRDNIRFPLDVRKVPKADGQRRVNELLAVVGLMTEADRYPHEISGGQAQRCALARALAPRPSVLLLDEPLSALDVVVRVRLRDEIRRIQKQVGTTTLYVTHDQGEGLAIGDRVVVMNKGRIEQVGSPTDVYERPETAFCAGFVGNRNVLLLPVVDGHARFGAGLDMAVSDVPDGWANVVVSPEDVKVVDASRGGSPATVTGRTFHGSVTRLQLESSAGGRTIALGAELSSRAALKFHDGEQVGVHFDQGRLVAFPGETPVTDR
jgi:ABC-type Fe3+/spermidine/putrescine transport system ATPase subunit